MIETFIESNKMKAKVNSTRTKAPFVWCRLLSAGKEQVLAVFLKQSSLDFAKIGAIGGGEVKPLDGISISELTGYEREFLPPVSIYGVKVLIDKRVAEQAIVQCIVGARKFLLIPVSEIKDFNDDAEIADITREGLS